MRAVRILRLTISYLKQSFQLCYILHMSRTADARRPVELLDAIAGHIQAHGVAELSLRPLAKAVGSSPRVLLYYFGSKEDLVVKALGRLRERQQSTYAKMKSANFAAPSDACRAIWKSMSAPESEGHFRMFFESYSMALRHPRRFRAFLSAAVEDWIEFLAAPMIRKGVSEKDARTHATIVLAGFRGFMLDFCASRDRKRLDAAFELWLSALDSIHLAKEISHGN